MREKTKTPGQIAYEAECAIAPIYPDGSKRKTWRQLSELARQSWEKNPTPRKLVARRAS